MPLKKKMLGGNCPSGFICFDNTTILMLIIIILIIIIAFLYYRQPYNQPVEKKENSIKYEEPSTYVLPSEKIYVVDERPSLFDYRYWYPSSYWYPSRYGSNYYDNRTTHYHNDNNHNPRPKPEKPRPRPEQPITQPKSNQPITQPKPDQPITQPKLEQFILNPEKDTNTSSLALSEPALTVKNETPLQLPSRNDPIIMNKEPVVMNKEPVVINEKSEVNIP